MGEGDRRVWGRETHEGSILGGDGLNLAHPAVCTERAKDRLAAGEVGRGVEEGWQPEIAASRELIDGVPHCPWLKAHWDCEGERGLRSAPCCNTDPHGRLG